jgi:hypothetical protein
MSNRKKSSKDKMAEDSERPEWDWIKRNNHNLD